MALMQSDEHGVSAPVACANCQGARLSAEFSDRAPVTPSCGGVITAHAANTSAVIVLGRLRIHNCLRRKHHPTAATRAGTDMRRNSGDKSLIKRLR